MSGPEEQQRELTEKYILPYTNQILADVRELRGEIDVVLSRDEKILARVQEWKKPYPIGFCAEIRNELLSRLQRELQNPFIAGSRRLGLRQLQKFVEAGGIIQPIWGIDDGKYFQNAIQIGDAILDVANDTVNPQKEKIVFYASTATSHIQPISSFEEFAEVTEKYWKHDVYPNIYLPQLALEYPLLAIVEAHKGEEYVDAVILLKVPHDLHEKNLQSLFSLAENFIFRSAYSEKRLPESLVAELQKNPRLSDGKSVVGQILAKIKKGSM